MPNSRSHEEIANTILCSNRYLAMATTDGTNPWVAALAYVVEGSHDLLFYSATAARHSVHIASNPKVAISIFDSRASSDDADGLQVLAHVAEVAPDELET